MANRKKQVYKPKPMTEGKRNLIQGLLQEYDIQSDDDIQEALKDLLSGTIQDMLETEMDSHLGYDRPRTPHTCYEQFLALCRFGSLARWIFRSDHNQDDYPFLFQAYLESFRTEDPLMLPEYRQRTEYHTPEAILESDFSFPQSLVMIATKDPASQTTETAQSQKLFVASMGSSRSMFLRIDRVPLNLRCFQSVRKTFL